MIPYVDALAGGYAAKTPCTALQTTPPDALAVPCVFRELEDPAEIVALMRLRHRIYFEDNAYGAHKPLQLDLTVHDSRSRLFGVFRAGQLVGGVRIVYRTEQANARIFRALHAVVRDTAVIASASDLPSEGAFDLHAVPGTQPAQIEAELGRFVLDRTASSPWLVQHLMTCSIAVLHRQGCEAYLYSCSTTNAKSYARIANPYWTFGQATSPGMHSDQFLFPKPTVASVARPKDARPNAALHDYVDQLVQHDEIEFVPRRVRVTAAAL